MENKLLKPKTKFKDPIKYPFLFAVPALLVYIIFFIYPSVSGFYYAFTNWNERPLVMISWE